MDYKDIEKVNSEIKFTQIKGKDYALVASRQQAYRKLYPEGRIYIKGDYQEPKKTYNEEGKIIREQRVYLAEAFIYNGNGDLLANNKAEEIEGSSDVNRGSFVENAITSAVGRALALCGIGSNEDIASAEEMIGAQGFDLITPLQAKALEESVKEAGADAKYILKYHGVKSFEEMTARQYGEVVKYLNRKAKEAK